MTLDKPYFLENKEWYRYNFKSGQYELTDKAPPKAQESYKKYYKLWDDVAKGKV